MKEKLTLESLAKNQQSIYIRNNALKAGLLLILEMRNKHGSVQTLRIPPTEVPICLNDHYSYETILAEDQLRKMITSGVLSLMDPVEAKEYIKNNGKDVDAVNLSKYADSASPNKVRESLSEMRDNLETGALVSAKELGNDLSSDAAITPKVQGIIASFVAGSETAKATLAKLKSAKHLMTENDLDYVLATCRNEDTIRKFAENLKAYLQ